MSDNIIKVKKIGSSWGKLPNGAWGNITPVEEEIEALKESALANIKSRVNLIKISKLEEGGKVYFHSSALFPRAKFKEISNNPIVRKPERADYIVINKDNLHSLLNHGKWGKRGKAVLKADGTYYFDTSWNAKGIDIDIRQEVISLERLLPNLSGKKFLSDEDLFRLIPSECEIKGNLYTNISKLLDSKNDEDIKTGARILTGLNYETSKIEIVLLLKQYHHKIVYARANTDVLFKSMIRSIDTDFNTWRHGDDLTFILELADNNGFSDRVLNYVNDFLAKKRPLTDGRRYRLIIEENENI